MNTNKQTKKHYSFPTWLLQYFALVDGLVRHDRMPVALNLWRLGKSCMARRAFALPFTLALLLAGQPRAQGAECLTVTARSRGGLGDTSEAAAPCEWPWNLGLAQILVNGTNLFSRQGGGFGGRGINLAAFSLKTCELIAGPTNFDTWSSPSKWDQVASFLDGLPNNTLIVACIADDGGIARRLSDPSVQRGVVALEQHCNSRFIRDLGFRWSFAIVAVKGEGCPRDEQSGRGIEVSATAVVAVGEKPSSFCRVAPMPADPVRVSIQQGFKGRCSSYNLNIMPTAAGVSYVVESSTDLKNWQVLASVAGTDNDVKVVDTTFWWSRAAYSFYRVRIISF